jgi:predicted enzyme related to lactoylglutathione lyase
VACGTADADDLSYAARMSGRVVHFEIPFDDAERARAFYREAFGWTINEIPELRYDLVQTGPTDEHGFPAEVGYIGGGMLKRESPTDRPVITVDVDDIDAALTRIESLGGMTVLGRQDVGDMGWAAYFKDVEGNLMGLWQART